MPTPLLLPADAAPPTRDRLGEPRHPSLADHRWISLRSSTELAIAAQSGSPEAAGELFRRIHGRARRAACGFCHDADADDAVAEGLSRALWRIGQLRDPAAVEAWMVRCVVRTAIDLSRQRHRLSPSDTVDALIDNAVRPGESAADGAMTGLERAAMAHAVAELQPNLRLLLQLRYQAGLSVGHIARALGKPAGTVRRQCVEARRMAGQGFLCRHLRPAVGECAQVTTVLCQQQFRRPATRARRRTSEHLRRCRVCRDRQREVVAVLAELGCRPRSHP